MTDNNNHNLPEELQKCLKSLVDKYEREDSWVRQQQIKSWKKNEQFWHGIQFTFWSEASSTWESPIGFGYSDVGESMREDAEGPVYDFVVNIYRAHGESIIAALGTSTPAVRFPPDNADDEDDLLTSRTFSKISDLIDKHNQIKALQLMSLFMLWNTGIVHWHCSSKMDKAYGSNHIEEFKESFVCETCGHVSDTEVELGAEAEETCPSCSATSMAPVPMTRTPKLTGITESPKSRVLIDVFGGLHVKTPFKCRTQKEFPYMLKSLDQDRSWLKSIYPHVSDKIDSANSEASPYEKIGREPSSFSQRQGESNELATCRQCWLRPWTFEGLGRGKEDEKKQLQKLFPEGVCVTLINDVYVEARNESMDEYWGTGKAGLSTYINADPLGKPLIPIQELRNVLVNLSAETVEQGMSALFADPEVLDFATYSKHEGRPGMGYPAKPRPGQRISDAFFETGRATLSKEVGIFGDALDKDGQFVVGSFPSLYGGPGEGNSRTLGEYQQSRQMALQRLSICWTLFCIAWAGLKNIAVRLYVKNLIADERYVVPDPNKKGNYINTWIKRSELNGRVGDVEPEEGDGFPLSTPQKQALLFKMMEMNNDFINAGIFDPENRRLIADLSGFNEIKIPGENQRMKQAVEISSATRGEQIFVDSLVDDHAIHIEILRNYLVDPASGGELKRTNPMVYSVLEQHLQEHMMLMQQKVEGAQEEQPSAV